MVNHPDRRRKSRHIVSLGGRSGPWSPDFLRRSHQSGFWHVQPIALVSEACCQIIPCESSTLSRAIFLIKGSRTAFFVVKGSDAVDEHFKARLESGPILFSDEGRIKQLASHAQTYGAGL